jgi:hypothetical protein
MRQSVQAELEGFLRNSQPPPAALPVASEPSQAILRKYGADYRLPAGDIVHLVDDGAYLWAWGEGQKAVELLRTPDGKPSEKLNAAVRSTGRLLSGLATDSRAAFLGALGPKRSAVLDDYLSEWENLVSLNGPLMRSQLLGAMRQGRSARAIASLQFKGGTQHMAFLWADGGTGGLVGTRTNVTVPAPLAYPLGVSGTGGFVGFEMMNGSSSMPRPGEHGLLFAGETLLASRIDPHE